MIDNNVVKILWDDDGEKVLNPVWHLIDPGALDARRTLCGGEVFGAGEGIAKFKTKQGKITCRRCIEKIKIYQAIKI